MTTIRHLDTINAWWRTVSHPNGRRHALFTPAGNDTKCVTWRATHSGVMACAVTSVVCPPRLSVLLVCPPGSVCPPRLPSWVCLSSSSVLLGLSVLLVCPPGSVCPPRLPSWVCLSSSSVLLVCPHGSISCQNLTASRIRSRHYLFFRYDIVVMFCLQGDVPSCGDGRQWINGVI